MLTINALAKLDPSKTTVLRKQYEAACVRRFRAVKSDITTTVIDHDAFALDPNAFGKMGGLLTLAAAPRAAFAFTRAEDKITAFQAWLQQQIDAQILEIVTPDGIARLARNEWQNVYVKTAYQKAMTRAFAEAKKAGVVLPYEPQPSLLINQPFHVDRLQLLYRRNFEELKGITQAMSTRIARELTSGLIEGQTHIEIAKRLTDAVDSIGMVRARTLARTELMSAFAESTLNTYQEIGVDEVGADIESVFTTANDLHVCSRCAGLEGKTYSITKARGVIPVHPNCFPGDTIVTTRSDITGYSKRWYDGDLIILRLASGKRLTPTVNHPILSRSGWIPAQGLQVGDEVVSGALGDRIMLNVVDKNHYIPTSIQEVTESLLRSGKMTAREVPTSTIDFHNDAVDGEICHIGADWSLLREGNLPSGQHCSEGAFESRNAKLTMRSRLRALTLLFKRAHSSFSGSMREARLLLSLFLSHLTPLERFRFALSTQGNPISSKESSYYSSIDPILLTQDIARSPGVIGGDHFSSGNLDLTSPSHICAMRGQVGDDDRVNDAELAAQITSGTSGIIGFDKIIGIDVRQFSGHVYNLQTSSQFYHVDGVVVHNCRCVWIAKVAKALRQAA